VIDTEQDVRDLVSQFLNDHSAVIADGAEDAAAPVVVEYLWVMAVQDALAPPGEPWYRVITSSDVSHHNLGLLEVAREWLCSEETEELD
jgi:hypothetical protein